MKNFKIGVIIDSFKLDVKSAVKKAKEIGAQGIQIYTTNGELSPENMTAEKRKEFVDFVSSNGLEISALCGDLGGHGFCDPLENGLKIEKSKRILDLALDLNTKIVTTHIGVVPEDKSNTRYEIMQKACRELAEYGDSIGAYFAIETGPERAIVLREFLDSLSAKGVRVNLDPANFVMVTGDDPAKAVYELKDYIVHTHAKDGVQHYMVSPEIVYGMMKPDEPPIGPSFSEVKLGDGSVNFPEYLKALKSIGYSGYLTIEREVGDNPEMDIRMAVEFLNNQMSKI
jgi:L-ribulose-5-phosphate 3-epimerase